MKIFARLAKVPAVLFALFIGLQLGGLVNSAMAANGMLGIPNTLTFDTWQGRTTLNTLSVGGPSGSATINRPGSGDLLIGPNSANSVLSLRAGSAGGVPTTYGTVDLNGIHGGGTTGVTNYAITYFSVYQPGGGTWNDVGIVWSAHVIPAGRAFTATRITGWTTITGVGAGNVVATLSDGTNTCTFTQACTSQIANTAFAIAAVNGAGTGCAFTSSTPNLRISGTSTCATTHPFFTNIDVEGSYN